MMVKTLGGTRIYGSSFCSTERFWVHSVHLNIRGVTSQWLIQVEILARIWIYDMESVHRKMRTVASFYIEGWQIRSTPLKSNHVGKLHLAYMWQWIALLNYSCLYLNPKRNLITILVFHDKSRLKNKVQKYRESCLKSLLNACAQNVATIWFQVGASYYFTILCLTREA